MENRSYKDRYAVLVWDEYEMQWVNTLTRNPKTKGEFHRECDVVKYALNLIKDCPDFIYLDIAIEGLSHDWIPIGSIVGDSDEGFWYDENCFVGYDYC